MEEKRTKLSFSIAPSKPAPPKPTATRPAAFSAAAASPHPAPRFVTTFDPSQPLAPPAAAPAVIPPLPNSRALAGAASTAARAANASENNNSPFPSSNAGSGLALRGAEEPKRRRLAAPDAAAAAATRRFKQDMAVLPDDDAPGAEEVPVEGFGEALLAGYGWKEGTPVGRDKSRGDPKVVERRRRVGTQGLGAGASDTSDSAAGVGPAVRRSVRVLRD